MSDLINRQDAVDAIKGRFSMPVDNLIIEVIGALPSAEPETIHCKDCKWFDRHTDILKMHQTDGYCMDLARDSYEDWYCSRAERKDDD